MPDGVIKPQWFSIRDAADYLDVGEPTLYRWMREGKITFRKVGDSTRFFQEDLDAMVQIHPSDRNVDQVREFCPVCHHDELVDGTVQSGTSPSLSGGCRFRPEKTRFWTFMTGDVATHAKMCTRCGAISWFGDVAKLTALRVPPAKPEAKTAEDH